MLQYCIMQKLHTTLRESRTLGKLSHGLGSQSHPHPGFRPPPGRKLAAPHRMMMGGRTSYRPNLVGRQHKTIEEAPGTTWVKVNCVSKCQNSRLWKLARSLGVLGLQIWPCRGFNAVRKRAVEAISQSLSLSLSLEHSFSWTRCARRPRVLASCCHGSLTSDPSTPLLFFFFLEA